MHIGRMKTEVCTSKAGSRDHGHDTPSLYQRVRRRSLLPRASAEAYLIGSDPGLAATEVGAIKISFIASPD